MARVLQIFSLSRLSKFPQVPASIIGRKGGSTGGGGGREEQRNPEACGLSSSSSGRGWGGGGVGVAPLYLKKIPFSPTVSCCLVISFIGALLPFCSANRQSINGLVSTKGLPHHTSGSNQSVRLVSIIKAKSLSVTVYTLLIVDQLTLQRENLLPERE